MPLLSDVDFRQFFVDVLYLYEYVEDTNTRFNSTGERAPIDGVGEQI
jgi:hypothetical protein